MASVPKNQLMMQKLMINSAYENMGLSTTQVRWQEIALFGNTFNNRLF